MQVTCRDGSQDVCFGTLVIPVCRDTWGCPKTVLGCSLWNPPDTKSHLYTGMSLNCSWTSLVGSYGHQVTPACRNVPGLSWDISCIGSSGHQVTSTCRDVSGLSQTVQDIQLCLNSPGMCLTLVGNTGHPSKKLDNKLENYKMYKY